MDEDWIPNGAILTPNAKEFNLLFKIKNQTPNIVDKKSRCSKAGRPGCDAVEGL